MLLLVILVGAVLAWLFWPSRGVTLRFVEYRQINGENHGAFILENGTSSAVVYESWGTTPEIHYRFESGGKLHEGGYGRPPRTGGTRGLTVLAPGQRLEFEARLQLPLHQQEVRPPFQAAVKFTTPSRAQLRANLRKIMPRRFMGNEDAIVLWTESIAP